MTVNTVALLGPSGLLGSNLLSVFGKLQSEGKIKLVLIHRASSKVDASKAPGAESRVLDVNEASEEDIKAALNGVDILVSALNNVSDEGNQRLLAALAKSNIKAYVPSDYSINWNHVEEADEANQIVHTKVKLEAKAKALGIPSVKVHNGLFEPLIFSYPQFLGIDVKGNKLHLYGDALNQKLAVTSPSYLAQAIGQLVVRDPKDITGKSYTVIDFETTGQELADAFEKLNGSKPTITAAKEEELDGARKSGPPGALGAAARRKWARGDFPADDRFEPAGVQRRDVYQAVESASKA